jgi:Zn-dependent protease with chaperone function
MFALRGTAVSLSVFVIVYCGMSLVVITSWRQLDRRFQGCTMLRLSNVLFAIRVLPLLLAILITCAFAIPSFLLLEPRDIFEPIGSALIALGLWGAMVTFFGSANTAFALFTTRRFLSKWANSAERLPSSIPYPVLRVTGALPPLMAAGIFRPRILLSRSAEFVLNDNELRSGLNHEIAHIRRRDNLKKLLLRFVSFPGMQGLEAAWMRASEVAADDAAVFSAADALDLAAALIKLSRVKVAGSAPELSVGLVHGPASMINARVERLVSWSKQIEIQPTLSKAKVAAFLIPLLAGLAISYGSLLAHVHEATEWLIR